jgi:plastocyanin
MHLRRPLATAGALLAVLGAAACAREAAVNSQPHPGTASASAADGVQQVVITAGGDLRFHPSTIVVRPGKVRIVLVNSSKAGAGSPHNLQFAGLPGADLPTLDAGRSAEVTFTAPAPGTYTFVCSIHAAQGQTGKMIVR